MRRIRRRPAAALRRGARPRFLATGKGTIFVAALFALLIVAASRLDMTPEPASFAGTPLVHDGDTVSMGGERMRLLGVDAPELGQTCRRAGADYRCGIEARDELRRLVAGGATCQGWRRDRYRRLLVTCRRDGDDLNARLVAGGWALAYGDYEAQERQARSARRGLWAGDFAPPAAWRAERGDAAEAPHDLMNAVIEIIRHLFRSG
ncbi:MAG: thermonuclease family protein [Rhizobiaceae bacterium]|nr:thermonuclease family protein [Rhizobiaceae bacterium]MCV0407070.1 thermonuclease family protein [Rhizobiaceae bacterium]